MAAFPSSTGTKTQTAASAWELARQTAASIKAKASALNIQAAAGPISSSSILDFATYLADAKVSLQSAAAVPGVVAYAREQINDPAFDVVLSFNDMVTAVDGTTAWIIANFPKDGNGFLLAKTFLATGRTTDRTFTSVQTAGLRTTLDALIAVID